MPSRAPSIFVGHGSPDELLRNAEYHRHLKEFFAKLQAKQLIVLSAHWRALSEVMIASGEQPSLEYDFMGFPKELFAMKYAAPGAPELAKQVHQALQRAEVNSRLIPTHRWDHGVWAPLKIARPAADLPILNVSLPYPDLRLAVRVGEALRPFRDQGVAILGSGALVHNLGELDWDNVHAPAAPWAAEFEAWLLHQLNLGNWEELRNFDKHEHGDRAHPSAEHLYPVFVNLAATYEDEKIRFIHRGFHFASMSMTSIYWSSETSGP